MGRIILWIGVGLMAAGVLPLLLYCVFGPADGNPIGLGLLFAVLTPVGLLTALAGLLMLLKR